MKKIEQLFQECQKQELAISVSLEGSRWNIKISNYVGAINHSLHYEENGDLEVLLNGAFEFLECNKQNAFLGHCVLPRKEFLFFLG